MEVFDIYVDIINQLIDNLLECELILPLIFVCTSIGIFIFVFKCIYSFPGSGSSRRRSESSQKVTLNGKEVK